MIISRGILSYDLKAMNWGTVKLRFKFYEEKKPINPSGLNSVAYGYKKSISFWTMDLTHWGRVTHICVSDLTSISSDNGLSLGRRQAIIRTNAGILLIRPLGTNFSEFLVEILIFSFKKMRLKMSSAKRRPFCLGLDELSFIKLRIYGSVITCFPKLYLTSKII